MISTARSATRLLGLGVKTAGWVGLATAHEQLVPEPERYALFQSYMKRWARSLVTSTGGSVELTPESVIPAQRGARIVVANHRSPFDIGVLLGLFGGHAVSRADLADWPVLGMAARKAGTIFVDRANSHSGAAAIRTIRRKLEERASILVFPEGGCFGGDEVRPFKAGALSAVRGLDVEIVPVGLVYDPGVEWTEGDFVAHVLSVARRPTTRCVVHIGTPRIAQGKTTQISAELREEVQALVQRAREHWQVTAHAPRR